METELSDKLFTAESGDDVYLDNYEDGLKRLVLVDTEEQDWWYMDLTKDQRIALANELTEDL